MQQKNACQNRIWTIPNVLSLFRLLLVPVLVVLYCVQKNDTATALVLLLSGLTDIADGFIARHFNMTSDLGKVLDPIADKLTQAAMLFCLLTRFPTFWILLILLAVKEVVNGVMGLQIIRKTGIVLGAEWHGKLTTALLYAMMFLHIMWGGIPAALSNICSGVCIAAMLLSFVLYIHRNTRVLAQSGNGEKTSSVS